MNGIETYSQIFEKEYCEEVIRLFNTASKYQITYRQDDITKNQDERVVLDWAPHSSQFNFEYSICDYFYQKLNEVYVNQYIEKYQSLKTSARHSPKGMSVQKTKPFEGYHAWHSEACDIGSMSRVVNYMLYLNDVDDGGETEFLYQGVKITPEQGKLVFFPTTFMYPHRGNPIYSGEKYIITGWYTYDE